MTTATRLGSRRRPTLAALELGNLMEVEDRGTEARLVAKVAPLWVDGKPAGSGEGGFLRREHGHASEITRAGVA